MREMGPYRLITLWLLLIIKLLNEPIYLFTYGSFNDSIGSANNMPSTHCTVSVHANVSITRKYTSEG